MKKLLKRLCSAMVAETFSVLSHTTTMLLVFGARR